MANGGNKINFKQVRTFGNPRIPNNRFYVDPCFLYSPTIRQKVLYNRIKKSKSKLFIEQITNILTRQNEYE